MSGLTTSAKNNLVKQHIDITRSVDADARRILKANKWNLSASIDAYYDDEAAMTNAAARDKKAAGPDKSAQNLGALFDHYAGKDSEEMDIDGTMAWCTDLSVDPNDAVFFVLAELARAPKFGYFDRKPWIEGWQKANGKPDTIEKQKKHIKELKSKFSSDGAYFARVYAFCFEYAKEPGQKSLSLDVAEGIWPLLFAAAPPSLFSEASAFSPADPTQQKAYLGCFTQFLRTEKGGRSISKDVWNLFLEFSQTIDPEFAEFDEDAAWPSLIDEYAAHVKGLLERGEEIKGAEPEEGEGNGDEMEE